MIKALENQAAVNQDAPLLSILIPFYKDDPVTLVQCLINCERSDEVEILLYDDGSNDQTVIDELVSQSICANVGVRLFIAADNNGRSQARNILHGQAKADWSLFLDADMLPMYDDFIKLYLQQIASGFAEIIFGGFEVADKRQSDDTELHRYFSKTSDCLDVKTRTEKGPQYVCSSNLCVRTEVMRLVPFDSEFQGWGWEDSDWAARAAQAFRIRHADIPALHLGLESTETLLSRFKNSGDNYRRFTNKHPEFAKTLKLYQVIQKLKRYPAHKKLRPVLAFLVRNKLKLVPVSMRIAALKLWRASWYAEAMS